MAQAQLEEVLSVDAEKFFRAISDYASYPKFVDGCKSAKVGETLDGKTKVTYGLSLMMKDISYVLEHEVSQGTGTKVMKWKLVSSDFLTVNNGSWELTPVDGGKTRVKYTVEIDFKIPVPGFMLNKLIKGSLPAMVRSFETAAKRLA